MPAAGSSTTSRERAVPRPAPAGAAQESDLGSAEEIEESARAPRTSNAPRGGSAVHHEAVERSAQRHRAARHAGQLAKPMCERAAPFQGTAMLRGDRPRQVIEAVG